MIRLRHALLAAVIALAACTQYSLVDGEQPVTMANAYKVDPQIAWSKVVQDPVERWTVDGPLLHEVTFLKGVRHGQGFRPAPASGTAKGPKFDKDMTALEIRDLVVAVLTLEGKYRVETENLRPWDFGGADGFRFEFTMATEGGLQKKGFAVGTVHEERLYLILNSAAAIHYYDRYAETVERLVASVEII